MTIEIGKNKGGRGKANPWQSITVRIPAPCLKEVERIKLAFMESEVVPLLVQGIQVSHEPTPSPFPTKEEAIEQATKILTSKKGAKESMGRLLSFLYGEDIKL